MTPVPGKDAHWSGYCSHCDDQESFASRGGFKNGGVAHCYACGNTKTIEGMREEDICQMILSSYYHWQKWPKIPYNWHLLTEDQRWQVLGMNQPKRCDKLDKVTYTVGGEATIPNEEAKMKDDAVISVRMVWYGILALALVVGATLVGWQLLPFQYAADRAAQKNSHQYIEAKRSMLLKMAEEYEATETDIAKYRAADPNKYKDVIKGMENQQEALLARIREEAKLIPANEVPDTVRRYAR